MQLNDPVYKVQLCPNIDTISTFATEGFFVHHSMAHTLMFDQETDSMSPQRFQRCMNQITADIGRALAKVKLKDIPEEGWEFCFVKHLFSTKQREITICSITLIDPDPGLFFSLTTFLLLPDEVDAFMQERFGDDVTVISL